jgi:hypothetical protein
MTPAETQATTQEETQIASLLRVASRLIVVMEQEIATLRAMRPRDIAALQTEKSALAAAYEEKVRDLARDPNMVARVSAALQQEFGDVAGRFHQVLAENERALRAARAAQEKVLRAIVTTVEKDRIKHVGYGIGASSIGAQRNSAPLSLTLDRRS